MNDTTTAAVGDTSAALTAEDLWRKPALTYLLLLAAASLPGVFALHGHFFFLDDEAMIRLSPFTRGTRSIWSAFYQPYFFHYAPLHELLIYVQWQLFGDNPFAFRCVSLLLHAGAALGCFHMLKTLTRRPGLALGITLLWAAHPMQAESVAWVSEQKTLWCFAFCFWALALYFDEQKKAAWRLPLAALLMIIGCMAKAPGLVVGPLVLLYELCRSSDEPLGRRLLRTVPFLAIAGAFTALGLWAVSGSPAITPWTPRDTLLNIPNALLIYLKVAFLPWTAAFFHFAPRVTSFGDFQFWGHLLLLSGIVIAGFRLVAPNQRRFFLFLAFGWVLAIGPMLNVSMWSFPAFDRFQYFGAPFLFLGMALMIEGFVTRIILKIEKADAVVPSDRAWIGWLVPIVIVAFLGAWRGRLFEREVRVMEDAALKEPRSEQAHAGLAHSLVSEWHLTRDEQAPEKRLLAQTALLAARRAKQCPNFLAFYHAPVQLHLRVAEALRFSGLLAEAEALLVDALNEPRFAAHSAAQLGNAKKKLAEVKLQQAEHILQLALRAPQNPEAAVGLRKDALKLIAASAEIAPLSNEGHWLAQMAHHDLAKLALKRGDKKAVSEHLQAAQAALRAISPDSRFFQQAQAMLRLQAEADAQRERQP